MLRIAGARPALVASGTTFALLLVTSGGYGYHRDELYFLDAGRHLAWGYPDQPPLVPLLARIFDIGSLVVLRLPSDLSAAVVVLLAGLMAERLGASRPGQWMATGSTALCGIVLGTGHLLSTSTFLVLGTTALTYIVVVIRQGGHERLWILAGVVGGLTFQAHVLVGFVLVALAIASGLRRGPLLAGVIALVIGTPYVVWQATHGWPQIEVASHISGGGSTSSVSRGLFIPLLLLQAGPWLAPVWMLGLLRALRDETLRVLPIAFLLLTATFLVLDGKPYYVAGFLPFLLAAGAQPFLDAVPSWVAATVVVLSLPAMVFTLPLLPIDATGLVLKANPDAGETIGWPSFASQVEHATPTGDIVITQNYGEAGALHRYSKVATFSGHNAEGLWGAPRGSTSALLVGVKPTFCARSALIGRIHMPVDNDENGTALYVCRPRVPWSALWAKIRHIG